MQHISTAEDVALVQLVNKEMTVEKSISLEGKKDCPHHLVGGHDKCAVTWGPFGEQKKIQLALYWTKTASGNGTKPVDTIQEVCSFSLRCSQLMKRFVAVHI